MSTDLTKYDEKFAAMGAKYADAEKMGGRFISTRSGVFSMDGMTVDGNELIVIVLDAVRERTYYEGGFDPEERKAPVCYAFQPMDEDEDEMMPHLESMQADQSYFMPQNMRDGEVLGCKTCRWNEWNSDDRGKGKACKERRRLALLPAGYYEVKRGSKDADMVLIDDPKHFAKEDILLLKIPPTSLKQWAKYVTTLNASFNRGPAAFITRIYIEPDPKNQFVIKFEMIDKIAPELYETIWNRCLEAEKSIIFGYPAPSAEREEAPAKGKKGSARR